MCEEDKYLIFLKLLAEKLYFRWEVSEGTTDGVKCKFYSWKYWGENDVYDENDFLESLEELVEDVLKHLVISYEPR